jgi:hypothetical protein
LEERTVLSAGPHAHLGLHAAQDAALGDGRAAEAAQHAMFMRNARIQSIAGTPGFAAWAERHPHIAARLRLAGDAPVSSTLAEDSNRPHFPNGPGHAHGRGLRWHGRSAPRFHVPADRVTSTTPAALSGSGSVVTLDYPGSGPTFAITSVTVSPATLYPGDVAMITANTTASAWGGYTWDITGDDGSTFHLSTSTNTVTFSFPLAEHYVISVDATVSMPGCENIQFGSAVGGVDITPVTVTSISATPSPVHQWGSVHYTATVTPGHSDQVAWDYRLTGSTVWTPFGPSSNDFHQFEGTLGTYDVRASLTSGGVTSHQQTTVTIIPRPVDTAEVDYFSHWKADPPSEKWSDGTLSVEHPAAGEMTYKPTATITLSFKQTPGTNTGNFSDIQNFGFTLAGHFAGEAWSNQALDRPLASDNATDPTYSVSFTVPLSGFGPFAFELYADAAGVDLWASTTYGPSLKHGTLLKVSGAIDWTMDDNGVFTSIGISGISVDQARGLVLPTQHIPIRIIDHP